MAIISTSMHSCMYNKYIFLCISIAGGLHALDTFQQYSFKLHMPVLIQKDVANSRVSALDLPYRIHSFSVKLGSCTAYKEECN